MQFVSPLFLIGLIAVAVPIIVHLFNFRRYKKMYFSNVDMLLQLQTETKKQSQLKRWLILLIRIFAIVFFVLAFAQPIIPRKDVAVKKGTAYVSVYVDNSYSMESASYSGNVLDIAKQKAKEIANSYKLSDKFQLITNDVDGRYFRFVSLDEFIKLVEEIEPSPSYSMLADMMEKQYDFLNTNGGDNKTAYVISDYQKSFSQFDKFPKDSSISTFLLPIVSSRVNNVYIDSVALNAPMLHYGCDVVAEVYIKNAGDIDLEKVPIKLFVNDKQRAIASVDIPANSVQIVPMHFKIDEMGVLNAKISTNDYPIVYDDDFYFTVNLRDKINILAINGNKENEYLDILFGNDTSFLFENISHKTIDFDKINDFDFIILNELQILPSALVQSLLSYVENRGSLFVIPANDVDTVSYAYASELWKTPKLLSFEQQTNNVAYVNMDHKLYAGVFDKKTDDIGGVAVFKYYKMKKGINTVSESLITLKNGDDLLTVTSLGRGSVYQFATALQMTNTDFEKQALFVPTVYNMALYSNPITKLYHTINSKDEILLSNTFSGKETIIKLVSLSGDFEIIPEVSNRAGKSYMDPYKQVKKAGNYLLKNNDELVECVAFNYNRDESEMLFWANEEIKSNIKGYKLDNYRIIDNYILPVDKYLSAEGDAVHLWKILVVLALVMLLLEILLLKFWR